MDTQFQRRRLTASVTVIVTLAFVGLFVGIRDRREPAARVESSVISLEGKAAPARSHEELSRRPWSMEAQVWTPNVERHLPPVTPQNAQAKAESMRLRAKRRAFEGAPPTIPHPVGQGSAVACLACHDHGLSIGAAVAPPWSHGRYTMCTQCHLAEVAPVWAAQKETAIGARAAANTFSPLRGAKKRSYRAYTESAPVIGHTTWMRERCSSCHGPYGRPGLQTSHPERQNCLQCHGSSALLDQRSHE